MRSLSLSLLLVLWAAALGAQSVDIELVGELPPVLRESSGVAVSRMNVDVLWTHNDSDNEPVLYAIDITGAILGQFMVENATVRDWEDVSVGPCPLDVSSDCIYVADTGDNLRRRSEYSVYIVTEPRLSEIQHGGTVVPIVASHRLDFLYPDASHDTEGLAVTSKGDIYLATKGWDGTARLFVIPGQAAKQAVTGGERITPGAVEGIAIETGGVLPMLITGAALSPSGRLLVLRSYVGLHFYRRNDAGVFEQKGSTCVIGYREPQGEAVDFIDESTLVLTSESLHGRPGTIYRVRCGI